MKKKIRLFGAFTKLTKQEDGSLIAEGIASSETRDSDGEIIKGDAIRGALPAYMKWANVREMHQPIAAGTAIGLSVDDQNVTHISAHVVDDGSVKKVEAGVLKGFSIAGTVPKGGRNKTDPTIIEQIELSEISLVDRPANPDALISLVKRDKGVADKVAKGLYTVGRFAELINYLDNLATDAQWEEEYEGDDSDVPAQIKAGVAGLCAALRDMVAEETAELVGDAPEAEAVAMASKPGTLKKSEKFAALLGGLVEKKGAKFSAATAKAMGAVHAQIDDCHKALKKASDDFGALGYAGGGEGSGDGQASSDKAAESGELQKRATDAEARAAQLEQENGEAAEALEKMLADRAEVEKQLLVLKAEVARKGSLRAVPVSKGADATAAGSAPEATTVKDLIKRAHASGGTRIVR